MEKKNISFKRFLKIFSGVRIPWGLLAAGFVLAVSMYALGMMQIFLTGDVLDSSGNVASELVMQYLLVMLAVTAANVLSTVVGGLASERINLGLRKKLWGVMLFLPRETYDHDKGESLVSRVTGDCENASGLFSIALQLVALIIGIAMFVVEMLTMEVQLTLYMLLLIPAGIILGLLYGKLRYWIGSRTQSALSESTSYLVERTRNMNLIRISGMQKEEENNGKKRFQTQYKVDVLTGLADLLNGAINQLLPMIAMAITFFSGAALVQSGALSVGAVVVFYTFAMGVGTCVSNLVDAFGLIRQSIGALDRVTETLEIPTEDPEKGVELDLPDADISFSGVKFSYDEIEVLRDITSVIPKKKCTALIGENGSGKSTIFKLIERFYSPQGGKISFGDTDIESFSLRSWRNTFGYVSQECPVIEGTIRSNMVYGSDHPVTDEELEKVIKMANLSDLCASLPDGADSHVAVDGTNLSGGQKQCLAIARMIIHNPDYLLLDEATSSLDACSAQMVSGAIENLMKDRTTILIAHDPETISKADYVIMIKDGTVAAAGERETLRRESEEYRSFFGRQAPCNG